jgi:hypothetical protein
MHNFDREKNKTKCLGCFCNFQINCQKTITQKAKIRPIWSPCRAGPSSYAANSFLMTIKGSLAFAARVVPAAAKSCTARVARFLFVHHTKTGKIYQMATKYTK